MLVVTPYSQYELEQLQKVLGWAEELGGAKNHELLLVAGKLVPPEAQKAIETAALRVYGKVETIHAFYEDHRPWPYNPNQMFQRAAQHMYQVRRCPWFLNEPDVVPLKPNWLDIWEAEYKACGKPFMGFIVEFPVDEFGNIGKHVTGNATYPWDLINYDQTFTLECNAAFDVVLAKSILPHTHHTTLYQHMWLHGYPIPKKGDPYSKNATTFKTIAELDMIHEEAVIFHRNKDGTLIDRMREKKAPAKVFMAKLAEPEAPVQADPVVEALKKRTRHRRMHRRTKAVMA